MIDSGRRFFPMDLVKNLMDTMAANKMNGEPRPLADVFPRWVASSHRCPAVCPRTWIGGRMLQNLVRHGMLDDALREMRPFVDR